MTDVAIDAGDVSTLAFTSTFERATVITLCICAGIATIAIIPYSYMMAPQYRDNALITSNLVFIMSITAAIFSMVIFEHGAIYSNGSVDTLFWWSIPAAIIFGIGQVIATRGQGLYKTLIGHPLDGGAHPIPAQAWVGGFSLAGTILCMGFAVWTNVGANALAFGLLAIVPGLYWIGSCIAAIRRLREHSGVHKHYDWMQYTIIIYMLIAIVFIVVFLFSPGFTGSIPDVESAAIGLMVMLGVALLFPILHFLLFDVKAQPGTGAGTGNPYKPSFSASGAPGRPLNLLPRAPQGNAAGFQTAQAVPNLFARGAFARGNMRV